MRELLGRVSLVVRRVDNIGDSSRNHDQNRSGKRSDSGSKLAARRRCTTARAGTSNRSSRRKAGGFYARDGRSIGHERNSCRGDCTPGRDRSGSTSTEAGTGKACRLTSN